MPWANEEKKILIATTGELRPLVEFCIGEGAGDPDYPDVDRNPCACYKAGRFAPRVPQ